MKKPKLQKKATIVEFEYHYGFLYILTSAIAEICDSVDVYSTSGFINFLKASDPSIFKNKKINFRIGDGPLLGTYKAIKDSRTSIYFFHFSVQTYKFTNLVRLLKPNAKYNILYTPRITNWFEQKYSFGLKKHLLVEIFFNIFRRLIRNNYQFYIVHSTQMKEHIMSKFRKKNIISLPYTIRKIDQNKKTRISNNKLNQQKLRVVIPGSVDPKRRDYLGSFNLNLFREVGLDNIEFHLAGVPGGSGKLSFGKNLYFDKLRSRVREIENLMDVTFITHDKRLSERRYIKAIRSADILLMPVNIKNYVLGSWSAGIAESIEYDKRILVPRQYELPDDYPLDFLTYKNPLDMLKILDRLSKTKSQLPLKKLEIKSREDRYSSANVVKILKNEILN